MTKLSIDERDLRCTILEGVRALLKTSDLDHQVEEAVIKPVLACCDKIERDPNTYALDALKAFDEHLDDGSEWETIDEFWRAWGPRTSLRIRKILRTAIAALEPANPPPVCSHCNDTHSMELRGAIVACTRCPVPCQGCQYGGTGPYCEVTPCSCECHDARKESR